MTDIRTTLERIQRRVSMPEPAMEGLLRRRERRQRHERIAAAVVGLGVAAAGIAGAVVTLRVTGGTRPASEGGGAAAAAGGTGLVLPTVAIWTAIVVLGLTVFAAVRLRARGAHVDVEQGGRGPGGAAASARRPAAVPGTASRKGGSEMDSKPKTGTGIAQAEMPEIRFDDVKLRRTNRWLIAAVVMLAAALVAVSTWAIVDRSAGEEVAPAPLGLASADVVQLLEDQRAALNASPPDEAAFLATFTSPDAVIHDMHAGVQTPASAYFEQMPAPPSGPWLEYTSEVIQTPRSLVLDSYAAVASRFPGGHTIAVVQLEDGKIAQQWILSS